MDDPLLVHRPEFPILSRTNYLISNSLGAVPRRVEAELHAYYRTWADRGVRAWEETWWTMVGELGDLVAPLIGAGPGEVVFQPNVTVAHDVIFGALDRVEGRPRIVTDSMHFPSILYLIQERRRDGAEVSVVPTEDGISVDTERFVEAIDERTSLVSFSHVLFRSAAIQDVAAIAAKARSVGAVTVVDGYQAVGVIEVDVKNLGVDVYIGGCLKWLCGGPGAAFVWVDPAIRGRLVPRLTGWMAHTRPFGFEPEHDRRDDSWRFLHGTPNISALYAARPGLELIRSIGTASIRAKSVRQTGRLLGLAEVAGLPTRVPGDPRRRGGTVAFDVAHGAEVSKTLKSREILCDYRPGAGIRLSPHFYTRDDELDLAVAALSEILADGSWQAHLGRKSTVT